MKKRMTLAVMLTMMVGCCVWAQTKVTAYGPNIVRVTKGSTERVGEKHSLVVTMEPQTPKKMAFKWTIDKEGKVTFLTNDGKVLTQEGETTFTPITSGPDKGASKVKQTWTVEANEGIYGIGMLQNGKMSMRGEKRRMEQANLDDYAHFFQSIKGYGVLWDNYSPTQLAVPAKDQAGELMLESEVGEIDDYYFIYGGDADGVIHHMRQLTGKVPMQALWTYGFHQSRERYKSQNELLEVVRKYRELGIPFDGIIQDWQYWGSNYTWNAMDFLHEDFQQAQRMIDEVHKRNAHMSISVWASFGPHTKQFKELGDKGLLFSFETWPQSALPMWPPHMDYPSGVRVYNPYNKEARDIYWSYLSKMHKMGIDGWWLDSTDPDHHSYKDSDLDEMLKMTDPQSGIEESVSYRSVRNAFPLMTVGGVYDHQRADDQQKRPFILTRSFLAGQQRTGAMSWSGDIGSSWESLRKQIPLCLNHTLTANPNVNTDIGGFFCGGYNTRGGNSAMHNNEFRELYVRWMQFGAFNPMMRSHGADCWREIYYYGKQGEPVYDALVDAIKLRYRLLPTIYSQAWQVTKNDDSFMRALFMDFKNDEKTWDNGREFLFGHNILVCPVLEPFYTGEKKIVTDAMSGWNQSSSNGQEAAQQKSGWETSQPVEVYLPKGAQWYNYWTGERHEGGQQLQTQVALNQLPLFIKAGTILCEGPDVQYSNEKAWDNLDLTIYPGHDGTFTLYEDEGDGFGYEKGEHSTIVFTWNDRAKRLTIAARQGEYPGLLKERTFRIRLVNGQTKEVKYSGKEVKASL